MDNKVVTETSLYCYLRHVNSLQKDFRIPVEKTVSADGTRCCYCGFGVVDALLTNGGVMQKSVAMGVVTACVLVVTGCEAMGTAAQSKTVQGATLGTALGAGAGAIIGNQSGHAGAGTALGAGLGGLAGGLVAHGMEEQQRPPQQQSQLSPEPGKTKFCPIGGELYDESVTTASRSSTVRVDDAMRCRLRQYDSRITEATASSRIFLCCGGVLWCQLEW